MSRTCTKRLWSFAIKWEEHWENCFCGVANCNQPKQPRPLWKAVAGGGECRLLANLHCNGFIQIYIYIYIYIYRERKRENERHSETKKNKDILTSAGSRPFYTFGFAFVSTHTHNRTRATLNTRSPAHTYVQTHTVQTTSPTLKNQTSDRHLKKHATCSFAQIQARWP